MPTNRVSGIRPLASPDRKDPVQPKPHEAVHSSNDSRPSWDVRGGPDRRDCPTPVFSRFTLTGGRLRNRRDSDLLRRYYVDRVEGPWLWALIALVVMIILDGSLTLHILSKGGLEVNPVMNWIYGKGTGWFMAVKVVTAAVAFPFLTVHRYFKTAALGAAVLVLAYAGVMLMHAFTLLQIYG